REARSPATRPPCSSSRRHQSRNSIMNWDDPAERLALIQRVGVAEYQRLLNQYGDEHRERTTVAVINRRSIWPVECKYGRVFVVRGSNVGFATLDGAIAHASTLQEAKPCGESRRRTGHARQGGRHAAVRRGETPATSGRAAHALGGRASS